MDEMHTVPSTRQTSGGCLHPEARPLSKQTALYSTYYLPTYLDFQ